MFSLEQAKPSLVSGATKMVKDHLRVEDPPPACVQMLAWNEPMIPVWQVISLFLLFSLSKLSRYGFPCCSCGLSVSVYVLLISIMLMAVITQWLQQEEWPWWLAWTAQGPAISLCRVVIVGYCLYHQGLCLQDIVPDKWNAAKSDFGTLWILRKLFPITILS